MKYNKIIVFSFVILVLILALNNANSNSVSPQVEKIILQAQTVTIGTVTYTITPKNINSNSGTWDFEVVLDAHTGSLEQDLVSLISIVDNRSNEYQAIKWIGDPPGGHHREGVLKFSAITPYPIYVELKIQTIGVTEKSTLRWDI